MVDIDSMIIQWVDQELLSAKLQGVQPNDLKKGIKLAMKELTKIALAEFDDQLINNERYKGYRNLSSVGGKQ